MRKPLYMDAGISRQRQFHIKEVKTPYLDKPFHFHPNCELVFIQEGFGKRVIGDNISNFNEGDLVLMGPNLPHMWVNDDAFYKGHKKLLSKAIVIYFSPILLENILHPSALKQLQVLVAKSQRGVVIYGRTREIILQQLISITAEDELPQFIIVLSIINLLIHSQELSYLSSEKFINTYNEKDADRINIVYQFLLHNFKNNVTLDDVAALANMAPTAFCRFFKQRTQKTFSGFLNELRIQHACDLLNHSEKTITEICYEAGFHNLTNFNTFFKKITGTTATAYRKHMNP